jgi:hypothetical protein
VQQVEQLQQTCEDIAAYGKGGTDSNGYGNGYNRYSGYDEHDAGVYRNGSILEFSPETFWVSAVSPEFN